MNEFTTTEQNDTLILSLEEWQSLDRQIKSLTVRKKDLETQLAERFQTKDGQLSTVHNVEGFSLTKKDGFKYTLNKKEYNLLTQDDKDAMMSLGVVQSDVKMSESKVRQLALTEGVLLQKCFTSKEVSEIKIEYKGDK